MNLFGARLIQIHSRVTWNNNLLTDGQKKTGVHSPQFRMTFPLSPLIMVAKPFSNSSK